MEFIKNTGNFFKKETVLSIAVILAVISMFIVIPDGQYISYIDFRTLGILFCLMTIVSAFRGVGLFDVLARTLLSKVHHMASIVLLLVMLCFFLSMVITNDVALITFVPLTMIVMKHLPEDIRYYWILKIVVMQTIAANLGSMLTPIGNPQNLYLYGKTQMNIGDFIKLMLPYTVISFVLLLLWIMFASARKKISATEDMTFLYVRKKDSVQKNTQRATEYMVVYFIFFAVRLLSVAHVISFIIPLILVLLYSLIRNRDVLKHVDYALLGTFVALFIFIGNLGRIPWFCAFLQKMITGHEAVTAVVASQVMSNVPAAVLLAGFTGQLKALIIGTNIGGLGTLIASMASLISFKYIAKENSAIKGKYFIQFTIANMIFLIILLLFMFV